MQLQFNRRKPMIKRSILVFLSFLVFPDPAASQEEEKAIMVVRNYRSETITMNFAYFVREYSWSLMERDIPIDGDIIYKFPTGLPGCEYLIDWEIDEALLVISNGRGEICSLPVSICEKREISIEVRSQQCQIGRR